MSLEMFEKERKLQTRIIENSLVRSCQVGDKAQLLELAKDAASVAHKQCFPSRFGVFCGGEICAVYANMGPNNRWVLDRLRRQMKVEETAELAVAFWPEDGESAGYTFLVIIDSADQKYWEEAARNIWVKGASEFV